MLGSLEPSQGGTTTPSFLEAAIMGGEEGEVCAICLEPPIIGAVSLECRHVFHAECLLASFAGKDKTKVNRMTPDAMSHMPLFPFPFCLTVGETPGLWRCPCCRAFVLQPMAADTKATVLTEREKSYSTGHRVHEYIAGASQWENLHCFLRIATRALAEQTSRSCCPTATPNTSKIHRTKSSWNNLKPSFFAMRILERGFPPVAKSITAFWGHTRLMSLVDPKAPPPAARVGRYIVAVFLSTAAVVACIWVLQMLMDLAGPAACKAADIVERAMGRAALAEACQPMTSGGWVLPILFGILGLYITLQISWLHGMTLRRVLLQWDDRAVIAVGLWFVVCLAYTAFVYLARFLLTLFVAISGPLNPSGCMLTLHDVASDCL